MTNFIENQPRIERQADWACFVPGRTNGTFGNSRSLSPGKGFSSQAACILRQVFPALFHHDFNGLLRRLGRRRNLDPVPVSATSLEGWEEFGD
jgi:hypothetical protein